MRIVNLQAVLLRVITECNGTAARDVMFIVQNSFLAMTAEAGQHLGGCNPGDEKVEEGDRRFHDRGLKAQRSYKTRSRVNMVSQVQIGNFSSCVGEAML